MDDAFIFFQAKLLQHAIHTVGAENAHQIILQRQEELRPSGIALTTGAAAQLIVDAAAFMAFRTDYIEPTGGQCLLLLFFDFSGYFCNCLVAFLTFGKIGQFLIDAHIQIAAKLNIRTASSHIGCNRNGTGHTGLGHDRRLLLMIAGVQNLHILDFFRPQKLGKKFRFFD